MRIEVVRGDLTSTPTEAVVNAANSSLLGGGGVDGALHQAAGPELLRACRLVRATTHPDGLSTGDAVATLAGDLPARFVIHTVGPIVPSHQPTADDEAALASCYRSILDAASAHGGISTVGFCAISTGVFGYPKDAGARVAIGTIRDWLTDHPDSSIEPLVSAFAPADEAVYLDAIREVLA